MEEQVAAGSKFTSPYGLANGGIAQLGEHLPCKQGVKGSNPFISTIVTTLYLVIIKWAYSSAG